ncbi:MAG: glycosyltransferase [Oscillospiraceae bacterium]|nr:glycosyltransferase [Oscillospiraceae bacterium]
MDTVLIPAYEPDEQLISLAKRLKDEGFAVVVVDDGSGPDYQGIFDRVKEFAHILTHEHNRGKGAALKTGMAYIRDHMPESEHFITCDADGQHRVEDVIRVSKQLQAGHKFVLTIRKRRKDIPLRSRVGNFMSRVVYALLTKRYLSDNQSGLRGFHRSYIDWLVKVEKNNYDYEMNVLYYAAKKAIPIATILIDAIYINNNQSSHFNPIKDTVRIYRSLFQLAIGLFIGFAVTEIWVITVSLLFGYRHLPLTIPGAGIVSYAVNLIVNECFVFRNTRCHDRLTLLIHQIIAHTLYLLGCVLFFYACPQVPLWVAFNLVFLVCIPLRYWLHKFTFIALRTQQE